VDVSPHRIAFGCLAACVPAGATRFRIHDEGLAAALTSDGAQLVRDAREPADVEITAGAPLEGDAACVVVTFEVDAARHAQGPWFLRSARRLVGHTVAQTRAALARLSLRQHGHRPAFVVWWDKGHRFRPPGSPPLPGRLAADKRLPQRAAVVGFRGRPFPSVLDAALTEARMSTGLPLRPQWSMAGTGGQLVVMTDTGVLRVALGPGRRRVRDQSDALSGLWGAQPSGPVRHRSPQLLARGSTGLADWSLEERLAGRRPSVPLSPILLRDCLGFLVALHRCGDGTGGDSDRGQAQARTVARVCTAKQAEILQSLAAEVDVELATIPRGWAHGDFWPGNLLVDGGRLVGVIDWFTAGPGRPGGLDLLHLHLSLHRRRGAMRWGPAVVDELLPWARRGGDGLFRAYCHQVGMALDAKRLRLLVAAYWLERVANGVDHYPERAHQPRWVRNNVDVVLPAFVSDRDGGPAGSG
jgi:hypothetical protein